MKYVDVLYFFFSSRRRHTRFDCDWSSDVCSSDLYTWNEALHAARDRLTPPFAHRHSYEEVAGWFIAERYGRLELLRDEPRPEGVADTVRRNVGIRGFRLQDVPVPAPAGR